jgi:hypothetical protein
VARASAGQRPEQLGSPNDRRERTMARRNKSEASPRWRASPAPMPRVVAWSSRWEAERDALDEQMRKRLAEAEPAAPAAERRGPD